jgi:hypothetical protein
MSVIIHAGAVKIQPHSVNLAQTQPGNCMKTVASVIQVNLMLDIQLVKNALMSVKHALDILQVVLHAVVTDSSRMASVFAPQDTMMMDKVITANHVPAHVVLARDLQQTA